MGFWRRWMRGGYGVVAAPFTKLLSILYCNLRHVVTPTIKKPLWNWRNHSPNRFIWWGSNGVGWEGAMGQSRLRSRKPRTTFVRRRGTCCMSPLLLCVLGRTTFAEKHNGFITFSSQDWSGSPNRSKKQRQNTMACPKNAEMLISGKKAAGGPT